MDSIEAPRSASSTTSFTEFRLLGVPPGGAVDAKGMPLPEKGKHAAKDPHHKHAHLHRRGALHNELAAVTYERNLKGDCPRKLTLVTRGTDEKGKRAPAPAPSTADASGLLEALRAGQWQALRTYATKAPRWNPNLGRYEASFTDRIKQASVRNFQLVLPAETGEEVLLQFGKSGKHRYSLDFSAPLAPVEARAVRQAPRYPPP